jgi:hypothetical protein
MRIELAEYLDKAYNNIVGFCPHQTIWALDFLENIDINKHHGVMEIGVHHGQFFIALNSIVDPQFSSVAVDVFERQDLNIDFSGEGDRNIFENNLLQYDVHQGKNVIIAEGDSTDHRTFDQLPTAYRYISVDGGHTIEHVINDMQLAATFIANEGVVIVDDYFNHWWPSVTEGIFKYMSMTPTLVPFMSTPNKLWFCKLSYKNRYYAHMNQVTGNKCCTKLFGHDIIDLC